MNPLGTSRLGSRVTENAAIKSSAYVNLLKYSLRKQESKKQQ
jgi:hypothetical protein